MLGQRSPRISPRRAPVESARTTIGYSSGLRLSRQAANRRSRSSSSCSLLGPALLLEVAAELPQPPERAIVVVTKLAAAVVDLGTNEHLSLVRAIEAGQRLGQPSQDLKGIQGDPRAIMVTDAVSRLVKNESFLERFVNKHDYGPLKDLLRFNRNRQKRVMNRDFASDIQYSVGQFSQWPEGTQQ